MRKRIKSALDRLGLLESIEPLYFNSRSLTPRVLWNEIRPGARTAPDGHPYPPSDLIYAVIASRWRALYWTSGMEIVDHMERMTGAVGRPLDSLSSVLDFGCGSARLLRHVRSRTDATLHGSDYNSELVDWCTRNLPFASFSTNDAEPPLTYEDDRFDFIYARSVFTHLTEAMSRNWMRELHRVLEPGGLLYFTMHGEPLARGLNGDQRREFEEGGMVVTFTSVAGENLCSTYAGRRFVESELLADFRLLSFEEGGTDRHLRQDVYIAQKEPC